MHLELAETISQRLSEHLAAELEIKQDALLLELDNGVMLEIRYAAPDAYAFNWVWGEAMLRIDTAPCHADIGGSHLHTAGGEVRADHLTRPGADPMDNLRALMDALRDDPLLGTAP
ncbi:MAG: hypothetical protein HGA47_13345 [Zoogloea sp.]|nr:hypothetical protein [Zoogloea sp.]